MYDPLSTAEKIISRVSRGSTRAKLEGQTRKAGNGKRERERTTNGAQSGIDMMWAGKAGNGKRKRERETGTGNINGMWL